MGSPLELALVVALHLRGGAGRDGTSSPDAVGRMLVVMAKKYSGDVAWVFHRE